MTFDLPMPSVMYHVYYNILLHSDLVWKVARYTSAAPFYFRPEDRYIDGGLLAPNPSLHALTTIQDHLRRSGSDVGVSLVVSIGAGINQISDYSKIKMNMSNILVPGLSVPVLRFFGHVVSDRLQVATVYILTKDVFCLPGVL